MPLLYQQRLADAAAERERAEQDAALRQALALQAFGGAPGTQNLDPTQPVPGLGGVTDTMSPQAGLQQELANDTLEQQRQAAAPAVSALMQNALLTRAGLDPYKMAQARLETLRGNLLADNAGSLTPAAQVNAANKLDVSPVRSEGGVFYNRFNAQVPFIGMSEPAAARADASWAAARASDAAAGASGARARLYGSQADIAALRLDALRGVLDQADGNPLLAADVANAKTVNKPQRVKVKDPAGDRYYDAIPRLGGGFDYKLVTDAAGKPLQVPASESDGRTATMKDTQFIAETKGLTTAEALDLKLKSRGKSDQTLRDEIALRLISSDPVTARLAATNPAEFQAKVEQTFRVIRPPVAVPPAAPAPAPAPAPAGAPAPTAAAAPAPAAAGAGTGGPPASYPGARRSPIDGLWYIPDPARPGKYLRVND